MIDTFLASTSAYTRYAAGTLEILRSFFEKRPTRQKYLIIEGSTLAGAGTNNYELS